MSDIDVIKEFFASVSDMLHGTIGRVFLFLWLLLLALMLIIRSIKLLCCPRKIEYSVGSEEIKKQFDRIMKGEKPWNDAPATADADAGAHNADCSSS